MNISKEVKVSDSILNKIKEKCPNMLIIGTEEFEKIYQIKINENLEDTNLNQLLLGWIFTEFTLFDGKTFNKYIKENLNLNDDEIIFLGNVSSGIFGFFDVISIEKNIVKIKDILTKKNYEVETIDLNGLNLGDLIEAKLVKNFKDNLYFYGAMIKHNDERDEIIKTVEVYFEKFREK